MGRIGGHELSKHWKLFSKIGRIKADTGHTPICLAWLTKWRRLAYMVGNGVPRLHPGARRQREKFAHSPE